MLLLSCAAALPCGSVQAQEVRGVILDTETSEGVSLAYVGLLEPGRELVAAALADENGRFVLRAPAAGSYFLTVERIGYGTVMDGLFELPEGGSIELQIGLKPTAVPLDALIVEVEGPSRDLRVNGYYDRKALGRGTFIERADLDFVFDNVTDVFRTVLSGHGGDALAGADGVLRAAESGGLRPPGGDDVRSHALPRRAGRGVRQHRAPGTARAPGRLGLVQPSEVEAIEVYTGPAETPPEYEATGGCGAIVIWTRIR